jgi:Cu/Ag efflux protein CusF
VDAAAGKLTIRHGPLENLGMGPMTMVFKVKDPAMLSQVKAGDSIDFVAEELDGALTVTELHKQ